MKAKAWRDIWGAGQGLGQINDVPSVGVLVERLKTQLSSARSTFLERTSLCA